MCDPVTIAGIALSVGSAAANASAQSQAAKARADVLAAERIRQQSYDRETDALNATSQNRYEGFEGQQDNKAKSLGDFFKGQAEGQAAAAPAAPEPTLMPSSSSNIVNAEEARQRGKATDFTNKQGEALGELRSFGDLLGGIGRLQARDAGYIGQIGGFKKGSSNVVPLELEAAAQKGGGMKLLGDLLGGFGQLGISAGLSGGGFGGGGGIEKQLLANPLGLGTNVKSSAIAPTFASRLASPSAGPMQLGFGASSVPTFAQGKFNPFQLY